MCKCKREKTDKIPTNEPRRENIKNYLFDICYIAKNGVVRTLLKIHASILVERRDFDILTNSPPAVSVRLAIA